MRRLGLIFFFFLFSTGAMAGLKRWDYYEKAELFTEDVYKNLMYVFTDKTTKSQRAVKITCNDGYMTLFYIMHYPKEWEIEINSNTVKMVTKVDKNKAIIIQAVRWTKKGREYNVLGFGTNDEKFILSFIEQMKKSKEYFLIGIAGIVEDISDTGNNFNFIPSFAKFSAECNIK